MKYHVFITPEGNAESLYVSNKTSAGFEVHESRYAHDSLAFDYRIVAKPFDTSAARLPLYRHSQALTRFNNESNDLPLSPLKVRKSRAYDYRSGRIPPHPKRFLLHHR